MRREIETRDEQGAARDVEEKQRQAGEEARVQQSTDITVQYRNNGQETTFCTTTQKSAWIVEAEEILLQH